MQMNFCGKSGKKSGVDPKAHMMKAAAVKAQAAAVNAHVIEVSSKVPVPEHLIFMKKLECRLTDFLHQVDVDPKRAIKKEIYKLDTETLDIIEEKLEHKARNLDE